MSVSGRCVAMMKVWSKMRRPLVLTSGHERIFVHYEGSLPVKQREKFRRIVAQRLSGEPTTTAFEQCCNVVMAELMRGEHHVVFRGRAS
jgi:hypothetical protein